MAELEFGQIFKNPAAGIRRIETMMSMSTGGAAPVGEFPAEPAGDDGAGNSAAEPAADKVECPDCGFGLIVLFGNDVGLCIACNRAWPLVPVEPGAGG